MIGRRSILVLAISVALLIGAGVMMKTVSAVTTVTVTYPNGGENESGIINITWTSDGGPGDVLALHYSPDNGSTWYVIVYGLSGDTRYYLWDTTTTTPAGAPAPSDGSNYLVRVYYTHNQTKNDTSDSTFTIDNTPPTSSVSPISPYWQTIRYIIINVTAEDSLSGVSNVSLWYRHSNDNSTWSDWTFFEKNESGTDVWSFNFTFPDGEGYYEFYSIANDSAGNTEPAPEGADARCGYDATPPEATITFPEDGAFYNTPISNITGTASDDVSGVYAVYVAVINETEAGWNWSAGEWNSTIWWYYLANGTTSWYLNNKTAPSWPEWEDGHTYTVDVWVYDVAGNNVKETYNVMFTYDTTPPISSVNPISPYWQTTSPITITVTANDEISDVSNVTLWYRNSTDNLTWSEWKFFRKDTDGGDGWSFDFNFPDGEGYYEFYSIANDSAGNTEPAPEGADTICGYDGTAPTVTIIFPENDGYYNTPILNINGTASDTTSGIDRVYVAILNDTGASWRWDRAEWNNTGVWYTFAEGTTEWYISNDTESSWPEWEDGHTYSVRVYAYDYAGNGGVTTYTSITFTYDTTSPTSWIQSKNPDKYWYTSDDLPILIHIEADDGELNGYPRLNTSLWYKYSPDNETWTDWIFYGYGEYISSWFISFDPPQGDGFYQLMTIARDPAGNTENKTDPDPNGSIGVDTTPPEITLTIPTEGSYYADIDNITGTATDATSGVDTVYVAIYSYSDDTWWNATAGGWSDNGLYLMQATIENNSWYLNQNLPDWENAQKYKVLVRAIDVAGNEKSITANFTILSLRLYEGWNLVSVPRELENSSIEAVFEGITTITRVYYYDPISGWKWAFYDNETESWDTSGGLTTIDDGKGYWIYATAETSVALTLKEINPIEAPPTYPVKAGWNLIGYTTLSLETSTPIDAYLQNLYTGWFESKWAKLYRYTPGIGYEMATPGYTDYFDTFDLTRGYWLYCSEDGEIVP